MDKNVRKCVLIAGAFATISIGNVHPAWASETSMLEVAQQAKKQIKGKVVDATGETVIGANVLEKGTTNGVITDFDGNFVLNVSEGATLEISYIAIDEKFQKRGLGTIVLKSLVFRAKKFSDSLPIRYLILDAFKDKEAWYTSAGFSFYPKEEDMRYMLERLALRKSILSQLAMKVPNIIKLLILSLMVMVQF